MSPPTAKSYRRWRKLLVSVLIRESESIGYDGRDTIRIRIYRNVRIASRI